MGQRTVVTGGDAAYIHLICDLLASIRRFRGPEALELLVLDCGLEPAQAQMLRDRFGARVEQVEWPYKLSPRRTRGREHLKANIARAFLDTYCPNSELICWVDADAWVQDIAALDLMFEAAATGKLAIVSQASRYGAVTMTLRWLGFGCAEIRSILYKNARKAGVREADARKMAAKGTLNAGVFALARTAPHWEAWRKRQRQVIGRARLFSSDQLSLGMAVYLDDMPVLLMPETCNYFGPLWRCSDDAKTLLEFYPPYAPLGVVHMAGLDEMRKDLKVTIPIETVSGEVLQRSLRYEAWVPKA